MTVTASMVKELRERTGAGMMECKKALVESNGDLDAAADNMRKTGLAKADKKAGRVAAEGRVVIETAADGHSAAIVEVNSETDFVAGGDEFGAFAQGVARAALEHNPADLEALAATVMADGQTVEEARRGLIAKIGENMSLRRMEKLSVSKGVIATYVHNATADRLGRIGVLVALESAADKDKLDALGQKLAMHIAAASPQYLSREDVDPAAIERERQVLKEQALVGGKPEAFVEKIVEGRINKFYQEVALSYL